MKCLIFGALSGVVAERCININKLWIQVLHKHHYTIYVVAKIWYCKTYPFKNDCSYIMYPSNRQFCSAVLVET